MWKHTSHYRDFALYAFSKRMFSRMARVKNDYKSRLGRDLLDACLRVSEEGCDIASFNPDSAISAWYKEKETRLAAKPHNYPSKRKQVSSASSSVSVVDIATITLIWKILTKNSLGSVITCELFFF